MIVDIVDQLLLSIQLVEILLYDVLIGDMQMYFLFPEMYLVILLAFLELMFGVGDH